MTIDYLLAIAAGLLLLAFLIWVFQTPEKKTGEEYRNRHGW